MLAVKRLAMIAGLAVIGLVPAGAAKAAPSTQDTQFLQAIHRVNLVEVSAGKLAQQKGANQQVKDLGEMFVTDHTELDGTVKETASSVGVTLPDKPTSDQQAVLNHLKSLKGNAFDTQWVSAQLVAHQRAVEATETEVAQGSDPAVVQVAQDALPVLQKHYQELVSLAQTLGVPIPDESGTPSPGASPGRTSPSITGTPSPGRS
jgi:predicted outer membrane protein